MLRSIVRSALPGIAFLLSICAQAQTTLNPGDVAVVGVNANNGGCGGWPSQSDEFSFVIFRAIVVNTTIDITDNGYERLNAGQWGDSEGLIRLTKTGAGLAAGAVVTVNINGSTGAVTCTGWNVTVNMSGTGPFDLASAGEQIFMTQGGTWTNGGAAHDMTFVGGRVLYGISTVAAPNDWLSFQNNTQRSGLPPGSLCFSMSPSVGSDWIKYIGPIGDPGFTVTRTARQWVVDIDDNTRWTQFASCALYNSGAPNFAGGAISLPTNTTAAVAGRWTGAKSGDWFDCKNWDDANVPTSANAVTINPVYMYGLQSNCAVGTTTAIIPEPVTASCASLSMTTAGVPKGLTVQAGKTLQVTGTVSVTTTGFATGPVNLTVQSGTLTAANLTLSGIAGQPGTLINEVSTNSVVISSNVLINAGGRLDLQGVGNGGVLAIGGNYTNNNGLTGFDEVGSTVVFNGTGAQSINTAGAIQEEFGSITLNKASGDLTLNAPVLVKANLTLTSGRMFTSDPGGLLTLSGLNLTACTFTPYGASFVHGPMVKTNLDAGFFRFPVGKGSLMRGLSILNTTVGSSTDAFIAEYFPLDPHTDVGSTIETPPLLDISSCEYFQLDRYSGAPSAMVTLGWETNTNCGIVVPNSVHLAKWDGTMWTDRGSPGVGSAAWGSVSSTAPALESAFTGGGLWTFATTTLDNPLPIELLRFDARPDGSEVRLDWSTASERDNDYFTVERSADGQEFAEVLRVDGAGTSTSTLNYMDLDHWPLSGTSFYRLRQTDFDGTSSVSNMVAVRMPGTNAGGLVLLNDADRVVALHDFGTGSTIDVLDMMGRSLWRGRVESEGRSYVPLSALASGAYVLRLSDDSHTESAPFVR